MVGSSPDGSPTPRKPPIGGIDLHESGTIGPAISIIEDEGIVHPSLGDSQTPTLKSFSLLCKNATHVTKDLTISLPPSRIRDTSVNHLDLQGSDLFSASKTSALPAEAMPAHTETNPTAGISSPSDDTFMSAIPATGSAINLYPHARSGKFHSNDALTGTPEVDRLREQLLEAEAKLAHLSDELAQTRSNTSNDSDPRDASAMDCSSDCGAYPDNLVDMSGQDFDFTRSGEAPSNTWGAAAGGNPNLMEGSVPDFGSSAHAIAPAPFEPGVIGQSSFPSTYRFPMFGPNRMNSTPMHNARPFAPDTFRRGPENTAFGNIRRHPSWASNGASFSFDSPQSSRSMTPVTNFGSHPPSTNSSSMSLPGLSQNVVPMGFKSQSYSNLSPTAAEFSGVATGSFNQPSPWNFQSRDEPHQNYMVNADPPNYRRLLERSMSCNWKYIVDKIVCNNDQQASIFLQQKLKAGTNDQKYAIIQAILDQAYPLMINRFGNFLIQRCFEHGTPEQVVAIARAIRGNTLNLSMDAFGCHVVQKAFDCAPEEYKAIMVHELLRRIPETVIHRYACHVWQKLFELRWNGSPPQIMKYVNEALKGMWHEVALGETGSLVVQNIFENCLEEDKRPCVNEVLASIDVIAHGQFGNWCIQHICEHGSITDRTRAVEHVLRFATEYSIDQFASKVVEKCLKIGGTDFLDRYLDRVCEARPDRPRMPLIDIAGDQFGNYLIQHILTSTDSHRREVVASHVRRHMVSLRGSKYGSRVAMLCTNPALATRPGPGATHTNAVDRAPGGTSRGYSERGPWGTSRTGSYDRGF